MRRALVLGALCAAALLPTLTLSCATSSGSTYSSAQSSEAAARQKKPAAPAAKAPAPGTPANAAPSRPAAPDTSAPSWNDNRAAEPDSSSESGPSAIDLSAFFDAQPKPPTGFLVLENLSAGSSVYVDGASFGSTSVELPLGDHEVRVTRFGYRDFEADFSVQWNQSTRVVIEYERASFEVSSLDAEPRVFDPADPGFLGSCEADALVSAPGTGTASVVDGDGRTRRVLGRLAFDSPALRFRWDARRRGQGPASRRLPHSRRGRGYGWRKPARPRRK